MHLEGEVKAKLRISMPWKKLRDISKTEQLSIINRGFPFHIHTKKYYFSVKKIQKKGGMFGAIRPVMKVT